MNSLECFISSQKLEIEHLKSTKEELNNSLKEANQTLGELLKLKVRKYMQAPDLHETKGTVHFRKCGTGATAVELWFDFDTTFVSLMGTQGMEKISLLLIYIRKIELCILQPREPTIGL